METLKEFLERKKLASISESTKFSDLWNPEITEARLKSQRNFDLD
jgi:hypothetical protein